MSRALSARAVLLVFAAALVCVRGLPLGLPPAPETGHTEPQDHGTPIGKNSYNKDPAVQELEKLKSPADDVKTLSIVKTQSDFMKNENGEKSEQHHSHQAVGANGELVAHVAHHETKGAAGDARWSELDMPALGQGVQRVLGHDRREHDSKDSQAKAYSGAARLIQPSMAMSGSHILEQTNNGNRRGFNADIKQELNNNMDHFSSYTGVQYSPLDMAEYIFWTGDERGVTSAIEEFLQDGLMSRDEAIAFLQEIKYNMEYLQTHYAGAGGALRGESNKDITNFPYGISGMNTVPIHSTQPFTGNGILKAIANKNYELNNNIGLVMPSSPVSNLNMAAMSPMSAMLPVSMVDLRQETIKRSTPDLMLQTNMIGTPDFERDSSPVISEEEYEEIIEKLRVADSIYTEYSLEEVIYQLAKVMFAQSLSRGTDEARAAAQRFTSFLQLQVEQGRISRALQKKVMDVLMTALSDTLAVADRPQWMSVGRDDLAAGLQAPHGNRLLKQFVEYGAADQPLSKGILEAYREDISKEQANKKLMEHHQWMKAQATPMSEQKRATMIAEPKFGHNM